MASSLTCDYGQVDLDGALRALQRAEDELPRARERAAARSREIIAAAMAKVDAARAQLHAQIVVAYQRGERVGELARHTGYNRETIRRILRAADVEPD